MFQAGILFPRLNSKVAKGRIPQVSGLESTDGREQFRVPELIALMILYGLRFGF